MRFNDSFFSLDPSWSLHVSSSLSAIAWQITESGNCANGTLYQNWWQNNNKLKSKYSFCLVVKSCHIVFLFTKVLPTISTIMHIWCVFHLSTYLNIELSPRPFFLLCFLCFPEQWGNLGKIGRIKQPYRHSGKLGTLGRLRKSGKLKKLRNQMKLEH